MQLIQYAPSTAKVFAKPLLMVPPCINKYYILDLQPETSFVKYAVEQGHTVFLVSWRNPVGTELNHATWDDYVEHGVLAALLAVHEITGQNDFNTLGFCVGGTLLSVGLAVLAAQGVHVASSMTLLTTLLDFSSPGVLGVFTDENQVAKRETEFAKGGLMLGKDLSQSFSLLRPNDLVWNYVVANYLLGQPAPAFDLLFWNSDSTNVAGPMFAQYLRQLYMNNALALPDKNKPLKVLKQNVDLSRLVHDTYILANQEDHIVPWQAAHQSSHLLGAAAQNKVRFVQGASGHIAGVINPASKNKRSYRIAPVPTELGENATVWDATAQTVAGSWWTDWAEWLGERAGKKIAAPKVAGNTKFAKKYAVIEPAPGRYVKVSLRG